MVANLSYGDDGLPPDEQTVYAALRRPGVATDRQVAAETGLTPDRVRAALQSLPARYYIHQLPSGGYIVR